MDTYTFEVEDGFDYRATIAISGSINLYGLAEHVIDTIQFDFDHAFGFYGNLDDIYKSEEAYTLFADMGDPVNKVERSVQKTLIGDVFEKGKKMVFRFDYGDDWQFLLTCKKIEAESSKRKVRKVISEKGERPVQYPDIEDEEGI